MITVRLMGGLGNQLFQYAAARGVAALRGTTVSYDGRWYAGREHRTQRLDRFQVAAVPATETHLRGAPEVDPSARARVARRLRRHLGLARRPVVEEHVVGPFDGTVLDAPDGAYLVGYFQSERYFAHVAQELRHELVVAAPPAGRNAELLDEVRSGVSVAVHVRRGDYASDPAASSTHGTCSPAYYERGMALLDDQLARPRYWVFSDEPEWARRALPRDRVTVVDHNVDEEEDLRLMAACHSHLIANSTFSWWGAWLAEHEEQVVVAPRTWFASSSYDSRDLVPQRWTRVEA